MATYTFQDFFVDRMGEALAERIEGQVDVAAGRLFDRLIPALLPPGVREWKEPSLLETTAVGAQTNDLGFDFECFQLLGQFLEKSSTKFSQACTLLWLLPATLEQARYAKGLLKERLRALGTYADDDRQSHRRTPLTTAWRNLNRRHADAFQPEDITAMASYLMPVPAGGST